MTLSNRSNPTSLADDRPHKLARVAEILDAHGADEILLTQTENLAWFFDGARTSVPLGGPPVFSAAVRRDGTAQVTALANETDRLAAEEITGAEMRSVAWFDDLAAGHRGLRDTDVADELRAARARLLPGERARYGALGQDMARIMTAVLGAARPETTERQLAAELARASVAAGAAPMVVLVAGESRAATPHPLPTDAPLGRRAMAVLTSERHGLHANLTRWVGFGAPEPEATSAVLQVEADALAATRPGRALGEVLEDIAASYARHGLGDEAWKRHHQGGPTGYLGRDPKATPGAAERVFAGQAFAWNPWAPHAKVEDTVIIGDTGLEVLTVDPEWPTTVVRGLARPITLDLS